MGDAPATELQKHPKKTLRQAMLDNGIIKAPAPTNTQLAELNLLCAKAAASVRASFYEADSGDLYNVAMAKVK
ncbi:MAG: hypothetical protein K0U36_07260 [Alphaproteobacteria bacterium]|nr:hypothetical protein [Alphaproteobacteria bacterium]